MTPAKAARLRAQRIEKADPTNQERREAAEAERMAEAGRWTFARLWEEYKAIHPRLKGLVTDENRFKLHIQPAFGDKEPCQLAPLDLDRMRLKLAKTKSAGTVKNCLELVRRLVNFAAKKQLCPVPGFKITVPPAHSLKTEDLTPEELARLLAVLDAEPNVQVASLMRMALYTGMRRGELFKLKWNDLDFERGFIMLRDPKGGKDQRIPMNELARQVLANHPRTGSEFVFPGRGGRQRTDIKKQARRINRAADLPEDFRPLHGLRHVYASALASSGQVDMYTLQKLLTHKSPQMTQRYAHLRDESLKRAADVAVDIFQVKDETTEQGARKVVHLVNGK